MMFVRIVDGGNTINGVKKRRVYIYKPTSWKPEQYNWLSVDEMKKLDFGRVYKEQHFILTQWYKQEILDRLTEVFGDNFVYIFE